MTCGRPRSPNEVSSAAPCTPACASRSETRASPCSRRIPTSAWTCRRWCCASRAGRSPRCSPATRSTTRCACCSIIRIACARAYTCRRITARRRRSRQRCVPQRVPRRRSSLSGQGTGMVIPRRRRSRHLRGYRRTAPIKTGRWRSHLMAQASSSAPTRTLYLLHGEDSFRIRLRAGELISALLAGSTPTRGDLASRVLVAPERMRSNRTRARRTKPAAPAEMALLDLVESAGGTVERYDRLLPPDVVRWIAARAKLAAVTLRPDALDTLASAVGGDTDRIENELAKLAAWANGEPATASDVRALVSGAIESDVSELTKAVVRRDIRTAAPPLERLLGEGNAPQQILALLLWQFRVLLFASRDPRPPEAERMAKAIRSSAGAILRYTQYARGLGPKDITRAYEALYACDISIKTGRADDDETALLLCVMDLCGVPGAD